MLARRGNPNSVKFSGFKLTFYWGDFDHKSTSSFTSDLLTATWNRVQIILPDTKAAEMEKRIYLEIETDQISLTAARP
jgi:hypothetical protein